MKLFQIQAARQRRGAILTTALLGLLALGVLGFVGMAQDRGAAPGTLQNATQDEPAPRLNFAFLPLEELSRHESGPPTVDEAYEAFFKQAQSTLIDIEYLARIASRNEAARQHYEAVSQLSLRFGREVFEPTRWSIVSIDIARQNPGRPAALSDADLWRGYHLLVERYDILHNSYSELREGVLGAIGIELDKTSFRRPGQPRERSN